MTERKMVREVGRQRMRCSGAVALLAGLFLAVPELSAVEEVKASHLLVRTKEDAAKIRQEIVGAGGDRKAFASACRKHSMDAYTKPLGGDLGWFPRRGKMEEAFSAAAFALQPGQISQPVQTRDGSWHLIFVADRRDRSLRGEPAGAATTSGSKTATPGAASGTSPAAPGGTSAPSSPSATSAGTTSGAGRLAPPKPAAIPARPAEAVQGRRRTLPTKSLTLSIESVQAINYAAYADVFTPSGAAELNLSLKNGGSGERKVPVPSLLPLGFRLTRHDDKQVIAGDFSGLAEPAAFFTSLEPYQIVGLEVSLNDSFKGLKAIGRFDLEWSADTFFANLEKRFPKVKDVAEYAAIKEDLGGRFAISIDKIRRDGASHWRWKRNKPYSFSFLPPVRSGDRLYARLDIARETTPVYIELDTTNQLVGVQHFVRLALEGFYDMLNFHEVREGDYIVGGCPLRTGTGAPSMRLPTVRNDKKVPHVRGTVSFVSRSLRSQGPLRGGQIGSIFFVCFKAHPEWDEEHVPFGKVVSGLEVLERIKSSNSIESVTILPASEYKGPTGPNGSGSGAGNPEIVIKTPKGDLSITLFENRARNTVGNFITLIESGFFEKADDGGKQKFFELLSDDQGKVSIHAGSSTNTPEGQKEYKIPDEVNDGRCVRGALVMTKLFDPDSGGYEPDSASTQFFICLRDLNYYDLLRTFTVFGQVSAKSLAVLDQLQKGDEIDKVEIVSKKNRDYSRFRKVR